MSFLGDLFGPVTSVFSTIFSIGKTVVGGVTDALNASGIAALVQGITSITSSIDNVVTGISDALGGIIKPITDVVDSVATLGKDIQDKIIAPIITPITTTITEIDTVSKSINRLVDQGLSGIVQIPKALADALGGIQQSWDQSTRQLADANAKIVNEHLVPGISQAVAPGLANVAAAALMFGKGGQHLPIDQLQPVNLEDLKRGFIEDGLKYMQTKAKDPKEPWDWVYTLFYYGILYTLQLPATLEPILEEARAEARRANPTTSLGLGDIQAAYQKNIIDGGTAATELLKLGYDPTRTKALLELTAWLPSLDQLVQFWLRDLITEGEFDKTANAMGLEDGDVAAIKKNSGILLSPQILLDMLARGIVKEDTFVSQLKAQGYSAELIDAVVRAGVSPASISSAIAGVPALLASQANWFASTYGSEPPSGLVQLGLQNRVDANEIDALWRAHWVPMGIQTAINLFFRGSMNRDEVKIVIGQNNLPPDMTDLLIESFSALVQPRSVPQLLIRGTIDESEARAILSKRGYNTLDVDLLIEDAKAQAALKKSSAQSPATKLSVAELGTAYAEGVIDEPTYRQLLASHNLPGHDIDFIVAMENYTITKKQKADHVATVKAEVLLGTKTVTAAVDELHAAGFTPAETEKVQAQLHQQRKQAAKLPTYADMAKMFAHDIITQDEFLAGIQAIGFASPWDQRMLAIATAPKGTPGGTAPAT